jgi:hypothetical protein
VTVFLDGLRLISERSFVDLTTGVTLVAVFVALGLLLAREVLARVVPERVRAHLPVLGVLALPLLLLTAVTVVARFVELAS